MHQFKVGDRVRFKGTGDAHTDLPRYYPADGTIGTVVSVDFDKALVRWPKGRSEVPFESYWAWLDSLELVEV